MKYKTEFRLKKGFIIHIDGIPYEYLGGGIVGTNTSVDEIYDRAFDRVSDKIDVEGIVEEFKQTNIYRSARTSGYGKKMEDWLRTTLTTLLTQDRKELVEVVCEVLDSCNAKDGHWKHYSDNSDWRNGYNQAKSDIRQALTRLQISIDVA